VRAAITASTTFGLGVPFEPNVPGDDPHLRGVDGEHLGQHLLDRLGALVRVPDRDPIALDHRRGGVRLERVVVQRRRLVGLVDANRGRRVHGVEVAVFGVRRKRRVDLIRLVQPGVTGAQDDVVLRLLVLDADER
jgi:hypothetical protein